MKKKGLVEQTAYKAYYHNLLRPLQTPLESALIKNDNLLNETASFIDEKYNESSLGVISIHVVKNKSTSKQFYYTKTQHH